MERKNYYKLLNALGILFCILFVIILVIEIENFTPYNTRLPFFADRIMEFLLPGILFFILARVCKRKYK